VADVVVTGDDEPGDATTAQSAHEAAVAEGAAGVRGEQAAESAAEAKAAAEVAIAAAQQNAQTAAVAEEAAAQSTANAAASAVTLEMIHEQQAALLQGLNVLAEQLKASSKPAAPQSKSPAAPDHPPARRQHFLERRVGGRR
jgi:hypothetical protein